MRQLLASVVLLVSAAGVPAADSVTGWAVQPFVPRRPPPPGQKPPPPQWYVSTDEVPAGAVLRIKVVRCPKDARVAVHQWRGGPVPIASTQTFADLAAGKELTYKADKKARLMLDAGVGDPGGGTPGQCKEVKRQGGRDLVTWSCGDLGDVVIEAEV